MRIMLINHYAGGGDLGMEHRPFLLAREWIRTGNEVVIVAAGFAHTRTRQPKITGHLTETRIDGVPYLFLRTPAYSGNSLKRVLNMGSFVRQLYARAGELAKRYNPEVVIASSTYPLDIWPASRIAEKCGSKLVYEVHDLWPLSPMELGGYSPKHPYIRLLQRAENFAYRKSDRVVSLLPCTLPHMIAHGMEPGKFLYVPNGVLTEEWDTSGTLPAEHLRILEELRLQGKRIIGYTGAMGVANGLEPLIEAAALALELPVAFLLVGRGPEKRYLMEKAQRMGIRNLYFASNVSKQQLPALLDQMDFLYVGFRKQALYRFGVSPNKIFDYMMAGKPVIQGIEACNNPVAEAGCGIAIPADDAQAIADAIRQLCATPEADLRRMGDAGRAWVKEHHDYRMLAQRFLEGLSDSHASA